MSDVPKCGVDRGVDRGASAHPGLSEWRPLARGGLAVVWEARQRPLDRLVAVKVYLPDLDESDRLRFVREAAAAGRLSDHDGVVTAHARRHPAGRPALPHHGVVPGRVLDELAQA